MEKLRVNDTPVRTARNFLINNIEIELEMPEKIAEFKNVEIINNGSIIDNQTTNQALTYGTSKILEELNYETANNKIRIQTENKKENIRIRYTFDDENINLINQIEIIANGDTNIIIEYISNTSKKCFHNGIIRIIANVKYTIIDIGGKTSISNYYSNIIGDNAENDLKSIYLGIDNQIKDINYIAELRGKKTNIDIDVQGALKDSAKKNFKGTIDFKKGAKKSKGNENEYCMLLSNKAKSIALPMLLCTEEDVEGNHSTASGKVDMKQLFYLMTRGLSYKEAVKLIVKANFQKIIDRINDEELKNVILKEIDKKLD